MKNIRWIILYRCTGKSFPKSSELSFPKTLYNINYYVSVCVCVIITLMINIIIYFIKCTLLYIGLSIIYIPITWLNSYAVFSVNVQLRTKLFSLQYNLHTICLKLKQKIIFYYYLKRLPITIRKIIHFLENVNNYTT